jgi:uncharacterized membrane protein
VQESSYSHLFGVIPVGLIGLIGFGLVDAAWLVVLVTRPRVSDWTRVALAAGAFGGLAFSIYLTCLEIFVIRAACIWCLTTAVLSMALLWVTAGPAAEAWRRIRQTADLPLPAGG